MTSYLFLRPSDEVYVSINDLHAPKGSCNVSARGEQNTLGNLLNHSVCIQTIPVIVSEFPKDLYT